MNYLHILNKIFIDHYFFKKLYFILLLIFSSFNYHTYLPAAKCEVYIFVAEECPISKYMASPLRDISVQNKDIANFHLVFPLVNSTNETAKNFKTKNNLTVFTTQLDADHQLTKKLNARVTPEAIITDMQGNILYQGRINDAYQQPGKRKHMYSVNDLGDALDKIRAGGEVSKPWKRAIGCFITVEN